MAQPDILEDPIEPVEEPIEVEETEEPEAEPEAPVIEDADPGDETDAVEPVENFFEDETPVEKPVIPVTDPRAAKISEAAQTYAQERAKEFESRFGYDPTAEVVFGWEKEAEDRIWAGVSAADQRVAQAVKNEAAYEATFKARGYEGAGKHFVKVVKEAWDEAGIDVLSDKEQLKKAQAMAIGMAVLNKGTKPAASRTIPAAEPIVGNQGGGIPAKEKQEAVSQLRKFHNNPSYNPTNDEIKEWMKA